MYLMQTLFFGCEVNFVGTSFLSLHNSRGRERIFSCLPLFVRLLRKLVTTLHLSIGFFSDRYCEEEYDAAFEDSITARRLPVPL